MCSLTPLMYIVHQPETKQDRYRRRRKKSSVKIPDPGLHSRAFFSVTTELIFTPAG
uniref:Uncharacterized protein n=1 Tax=Klebsiella pneumoniae TaxID=573 RepID=A0A8B0SSE2_KLEPN|nr:hypothetical protein [Klebsiella pneumoniae]